MNNIQADIQAPEPLVPSLLHIGAQKLPRLTVQNQGDRNFEPTEVRLFILELSVAPVRVPVPLVDSR